VIDLLPAIDIRGGRCVRLQQGDFAAETVYADDPVAVARAYEASGARWIHVVDLDAARTGARANAEVIAALCAAVSVPVEVGGGVREATVAAELLAARGVARIVIGTAAVEHPELVTELSAEFPGRVAVGLDARGRNVAVRGWQEGTAADVVTLAQQFDGAGAGAIIVTQIERDGMLTGPDVDLYAELVRSVTTPVIASGGVGSLADLTALEPTGVVGVIVGKALYEGAFTVEEALACLRPA